MTKKAAKKKQPAKKSAKKKSPARKAANEGKEESKPAAEKPVAEKPVPNQPDGDQAAGQEIPMVKEEPVEASRSGEPKQSTRVVRNEGRSRESGRSRGGRRGRRDGGARVRVDNEELGRKAWKVFQQEIAEEGMALMDEGSARLLAEKAIVLTRAFLEERERRLGRRGGDDSGGKPQEPEKDAPPEG